MTLDEMKKIAAARTPGRWHADILPIYNHPKADYEFIDMVTANWDKLMEVLEAAIDTAKADNTDDLLSEQIYLQNALEYLEK